MHRCTCRSMLVCPHRQAWRILVSSRHGLRRYPHDTTLSAADDTRTLAGTDAPAAARAPKRRKVGTEQQGKSQRRRNSAHAPTEEDATEAEDAAEAAEVPADPKTKPNRRTRQATQESAGAAGEEDAATVAKSGRARRAVRAAPDDSAAADDQGTRVAPAKRKPPKASAKPAATPPSRSKESAAGKGAAGPLQTGGAARVDGASKARKKRKRKADAGQAPDSPDEHNSDDAAAADSDAAEAQELTLNTVGGKQSTAGRSQQPQPPYLPIPSLLRPSHGMYQMKPRCYWPSPLHILRWEVAHPQICDAGEVSDKASPTKGVRFYDALKAKRWHPEFGLRGVTVMAVRGTLAAARQSPLWAPGGKKAPSSAAIAGASPSPAAPAFLCCHVPVMLQEAQITHKLTLVSMSQSPLARGPSPREVVWWILALLRTNSVILENQNSRDQDKTQVPRRNRTCSRR